MTNAIRVTLIAAAGLAMTACATDSNYDPGPGSSSSRQATSAAETACMTAVNSQYGGNVKTVRVTSSEFSEANSLVMVSAVGVRGGSTTERWRCLVSND
jgi:hypothetical protein